MKNIFIIALFISIIYLIFKFLEMRFIDKETKSLKLLIRDTLLVYISIIISNFFILQINPLIYGEKAGVNNGITPVFTDNPDF